MTATDTLDVKNLSSRKLFELMTTEDLPALQLQRAEQELLLRRQHLARHGTVYRVSSSIPQQLNHQLQTYRGFEWLE